MSNSVVTTYRIRGLGQYPNYKLENRPFGDFTFVYGISVGKQNFEDEWVSGYVNFLESIGARKSFVLVADTLQRHNLSCYQNNSYERAFENGQRWAKKYRPYFDRLGSQFQTQFVHWDRFRNHPDFPKYLAFIKSLEANDPQFREALDESIDEYTNRAVNAEISCTPEEKRRRSADYFIEECAIDWIVAQNTDLKGVVYPSKSSKLIDYNFHLINQQEHRIGNPFIYLQIRLKKNSQKGYYLSEQVNGCSTAIENGNEKDSE